MTTTRNPSPQGVPASATTQMSTHLDDAPDHALTDDEILDRHGALLWDFLVSVGSDPDTLTDIVRSANHIDAARQRAHEHRLRTNAQRSDNGDGPPPVYTQHEAHT